MNAKAMPGAPISLSAAKRPEFDSTLAEAIFETVAYADIFDYPLTAVEIQRYLIKQAASRASVQDALEHDPSLVERLSPSDEFFCLTGREAIVVIRRQRESLARRYWPRAQRYGRIIASLPFVQMVAITGELAMDNVRDKSDIDFFIVTEHRRLWLCRLFVVGVVHLAATFGDTVCPNYLLSERALAISERDLYSAHEVVQMIPLAGLDLYAKFRQANRWVYDFLPNAAGAPRQMPALPHARPVRALTESALRTPAGAFLEKWERGRKLKKFAGMSRIHREASFSSDWCKGHVHDHGRLILAAFEAHKTEIEGSGR
ncbi:MAG TPA: hypothetical protein VHV31_06130 [Nitrolancea sp.]|nr:hypothetical protein [Nitrolancea sp.]